MGADQLILEIISELYSAALDPSRWARALELLSNAFGAQGASFWTLESSPTPLLPTLLHYNFNPDFIRAYLEIAAQDPTVQFLANNPDLPIVHDGMYLSEREIDKHSYYAWQRQFTDIRYRLSAQLKISSALQAGVTLHRAKTGHRFQDTDVEKLNVLFPHLEKALFVGCQLEGVAAKQRGLEAILDQSRTGIILINQHEKVVYVNRRAEAIISRKDGIDILQGTLKLSRHEDEQQFRVLISRASGRTANNVMEAGAMFVQKRESAGKYYLLLTPVSEGQMLISEQQSAVCISVNDPGERCPLEINTLRSVFGLTEAEALLAQALAAGYELKEAADGLGITYGTARSRLAEIFAKTVTRRQADLVHLLRDGLRII